MHSSIHIVFETFYDVCDKRLDLPTSSSLSNGSAMRLLFLFTIFTLTSMLLKSFTNISSYNTECLRILIQNWNSLSQGHFCASPSPFSSLFRDVSSKSSSQSRRMLYSISRAYANSFIPGRWRFNLLCLRVTGCHECAMRVWDTCKASFRPSDSWALPYQVVREATAGISGARVS